MEDLLLNIAKEANQQKLYLLKKAAQDAYDLLMSQSKINRTPSFELRVATFTPLKMALESKRTKIVTLAVSGLYKIVRDERFQYGTEPEDDSLWLPAQLLHSTASMLQHSDDTQVQIFRVFLSLACGTSWTLNGRLVMLILGRCGDACEFGTQSVRAAAQAAASQTVRAFTSFLDEEYNDIVQEQQKYKTCSPGTSSTGPFFKTSAVDCFNEAIPVMQFICSKLEETKTCSKSNEVMLFLLECLLTLISTLPKVVHTNTHFTTFLWQRFCPALIALLGAPSEPQAHTLTSQQAKTVYSIGINLVRLVGCVVALRPVLEALFHRMVLLPPALKRLEPLRSVKDLLRSPERIVDLLLIDAKEKPSSSDDMAIIRLIMDSIEESGVCNEPSVMLASVECIVALLSALDLLCHGEGLTPEAAGFINGKYSTLEQTDYKGPLTYQSLARLPVPYRDVVANLRYASDSDSSGIDGGPDDNFEGNESENSGDTEGPEARGNDDDVEVASEDSIIDDDSFLTRYELTKMQKLPKSLHLGRTELKECNADLERHNARHFLKTLHGVLVPNLLTLRSSIQVDEVLQEFASKCCEQNTVQYNAISTIMNADGIYLVTYFALLLNLKLIQLGYYASENKSRIQIPVTEEEFINEIHGSGVLVYLSATWLSEVYQHVLANSILEMSGYDSNGQQPALINLLVDIGGLSANKYLTEWQKLERVHQAKSVQPENMLEMEAGTKLSRRVLTCCWDSIIMVLSGALSDVPVVTGAFAGRASRLRLLVQRDKANQNKRRALDNLIVSSLDGLHKAASLSNTLKLQTKSSSILSLLSSSACKSSSSKLHAAHALSLDVIVSKGLCLGSHSSDCWPHVFTACVHIAKLEHALFSKNGTSVLMVAQTTNSVVTSTAGSTTDRLNLSFNPVANEEETCIDVYSFLQSPTSTKTTSSDATIPLIVNKSGAHNTTHGLLSNVDAAKVSCLLSQQVDSLFHDAALKLNLPVLCEFLEELCSASQRQLFSRSEGSTTNQKDRWWRRGNFAGAQNTTHKTFVEAPLLLHRVGDVILKCIRAGRPLIHTMNAWAIVGPHLMEAACHKDRVVSKKAISFIHDAITAFLNEQLEFPHFHVNEVLFKPFENLLCLELCDVDVQDQIVSSLCEFVETNHAEIRSGWRPLFGTLRVANHSNGNLNAESILEVFQVFLSTDNTLAFAYAALDYILCLLTHVRGNDQATFVPTSDVSEDLGDRKLIGGKTSEEKLLSPTFKKNVENILQMLHNSEKLGVFGVKEQPNQSSGGYFDLLDQKSDATVGSPKKTTTAKDLRLECLKLLENCASILAAMYNMSQCPPFNMANRIQIDPQPQLVDGVHQGEAYGLTLEINPCQIGDSRISYKCLSTTAEVKACIEQGLTLGRMDKPNGILRVWYILLEGIASATIVCAKQNQPHTLETLFKLLRDLINFPGINFGFYSINHLLLPMIQNWLRKLIDQPDINESLQNFKQCCGMASELIVEYLFQLQGDIEGRLKEGSMDRDENPGATLALKQLMLILIECIVQANETIARLGASCLRHVILSSGDILTRNQWEITVTALHRGCLAALNPLTQLMCAFETNSDSFYGDLANVKVTARKDSLVQDNIRLFQLCQQVFLLPSQRESIRTCDCSKDGKELKEACPCVNAPTIALIDERSYIFLLYTPEAMSSASPDSHALRIPFKSIIVGLLAHQMLIQTIATILLDVLSHVAPTSVMSQIKSNHYLNVTVKDLVPNCVNILIQCLNISCIRARQFDARPGLKFLIQKVGNLDCAANLFSQITNSEVIKMITLTEICLDLVLRTKMTSDDVSRALLKDLEDREDDGIRMMRFTEQLLRELKNSWEEMCKFYLDSIVQMPNSPKFAEVSADVSGETSVRVNPFNDVKVNVLAPQPVPVEIQQQRCYSMKKDEQCYKIVRMDILIACLELFFNVPESHLKLLSPILSVGLQQLFPAQNDKIRQTARILILRMENE